MRRSARVSIAIWALLALLAFVPALAVADASAHEDGRIAPAFIAGDGGGSPVGGGSDGPCGPSFESGDDDDPGETIHQQIDSSDVKPPRFMHLRIVVQAWLKLGAWF